MDRLFKFILHACIPLYIIIVSKHEGICEDLEIVTVRQKFGKTLNPFSNYPDCRRFVMFDLYYFGLNSIPA
jgi:hypothetical protein